MTEVLSMTEVGAEAHLLMYIAKSLNLPHYRALPNYFGLSTMFYKQMCAYDIMQVLLTHVRRSSKQRGWHSNVLESRDGEH